MSTEPHGMPALEALLKRDRAIVLAGLAGICAIAWAHTTHLARDMAAPQMAMAMPQTQAWGPGDLVSLFAMWAVMMVAMMVPSAAPVMLLVARVNRGRRARGDPIVPTGIFLLGYLLAWSAFSALAASSQVLLHNAALLSPTMASASPALAGTLLVGAGIYEWTPLKRACLTHCRSPIHFLSTEWREGAAGALRMGLKHGTYCVGCCWLLMALLFVAGVMNLLWVAAIAGFVLIEKVAPGGGWVGRIAGVGLALWGVWLLTAAA